MSICGYPRFLFCSQNVNFPRQFDIGVLNVQHEKFLKIGPELSAHKLDWFSNRET